MHRAGHTHRAEVRRLLDLAWPVALTQLQWIILNVVDVAMVGHASTVELGYFGAGRLINWVVILVGIAALSGVLVFTSRADGAGDRRACGSLFRQGVVFALALALAMGLPTLLFARQLLDMFGVPPDLAGGGAIVLQVMALNLPGQFLLAAVSLFLEGLSRPRIAMLVTILTLPLNIVLNGLFVYGWAGAPALGAAGAALGTAITNLLGAAALGVYVLRMPGADTYGIRGSWRGSWREGRALRRFAVAPGLATGLENGGFGVLIALSTGLGAAVAGAFQVILSLHVLTLALAIGLASAAGVRVGNAMGAGEPWEVARRGWFAVIIAAVSMIAFGAVYLLIPHMLVSPFSNDPAVLAPSVAMLTTIAAFIWCDGVQIVMVYSLRAVGDQVAAALIQAFSFFVVMTFAAWLLVERLAVGPAGLAGAMGIGLGVAALLGCIRFAWITRRMRRSPAGPT